MHVKRGVCSLISYVCLWTRLIDDIRVRGPLGSGKTVSILNAMSGYVVSFSKTLFLG
jgi:hypothetical protein